MTKTSEKISVLILYNHVGVDEYEALKTLDPKQLEFTPEYDINAVSTIKEEYQAIAAALESEGYDVRVFNIQENIHRLTSMLRRNPPDVIFNLIEFFHDSPFLEASVAGLFELYSIPYTGATPISLALCQRKGFTKQLLLANGVQTPKFKILFEPTIAKRHGLRYPLIVKPGREDASSGVDKNSVVENYDALILLIQKLFKEFAPPILVEEYIEGRELHVSILGNDPPRMLPPVEYDFSELPDDYPNIITYNAKWNPLEESFHRIHAVCPAVLTKRQLKEIEAISLATYDIMECRDYARLDLRLSKKNQVFVLEVNPNPDLTEGVSFMDSAEKAGKTFSKTLSEIVEFALKRKKQTPPLSR
ncbi:MAG: D-alanine--D-alanine ligase [Bacteroidota bacterium]|jgi:D-alanine-D-alanine ligase